MATRKKADSGAYMSQYDTEVEKRLKALESVAHEKKSSGSSSDLVKRIEIIEAVLKMNPQIGFEKLSAQMRGETVQSTSTIGTTSGGALGI